MVINYKDRPQIDPIDTETLGVYVLIHGPSRSVFIGSSRRCIRNRFSWHWSSLRYNKHNCKALQRLWNKTKPKEWHFRALTICLPKETYKMENIWMRRCERRFTLLNTVKDATGKTRRYSKATKRKMSEAAKRIGADPAERKCRSDRAKKQHRQKNFGAHTWKEGPDYEKIANKWARTDKNRERLRSHIAAQSSEEMSRRSYKRKIFQALGDIL